MNSHRNIRMELEKLRSEMADFDLEVSYVIFVIIFINFHGC